MSVMDDELASLRQRSQVLLHFQDNHRQLLQDLFGHCERLRFILETDTSQLRKQLEVAILDLEDARDTRRGSQQRLRALEAQVAQLTSDNDALKNRHPYVAVLVDGDGLLFQDSYINDGIEGGKRAAHALRAAIMDKCGALDSKLEIVVKVCANQSGLATALRQSGSISNEAVFKQFCQGFTQSKASFDFIDVGYGKERADSKIRECARWHLNNANCKMVLLGISHDSGYAPFLDELRSDSETRSRLRILEGSATVRELQATNIEILNVSNDIFRSDKLQTERAAANASNTAYPPPAASGASPGAAPIGNGVSRPAVNDPPSSAKSNGGPLPSEVKYKVKPPSAAQTASYANASGPRASQPPTLSFPAATAKTMQAKAAAMLEKNKPAWNPGPRGLDPPALYNAVAVDGVKKRRGADKFCNAYIILGYCSKDHCEYNHKLKATPDERKALIFLMRQMPCTYGQDCASEDCIYGHHCPSVRDGHCMQPYCRYPSALHPPKTTFKQPFLGDD